MLRLLHKILYIDTTPTKRAINDSWLLRTRWKLYVLHIRRVANYYAKYAFSDWMELPDVSVIHERRDYEFENEMKVCGLPLRHYLTEHNHLACAQHVHALKRPLLFSYFNWVDITTIQVTAAHPSKTAMATPPVTPLKQPRKKDSSNTLLGKEHIPTPPKEEPPTISTTTPSQQPIKKKQFEIDSTF